MKIVIIEYGMGNTGSIKNMFKKLGHPSLISGDPQEIASATHLILPGVGAFDKGMANLRERDLIGVMEERAIRDKIPVLGICLGMQLLTNRSEEGAGDGLGWIDGEATRFCFEDLADGSSFKIPHMGWNEVRPKEGETLFKGYTDLPRFYFVHSFHVSCRDAQHCIGATLHGYEFTSSIRRDNIVGVQFHPEKSHRYGLRFLANFAASDASAHSSD